MSAVELSQVKSDSKTGARQSELRLGQSRIELPNRFPISPERNALKPAGVKDPLPGEVAVLARLAPPDMVRKILTQEDAVKSTREVPISGNRCRCNPIAVLSFSRRSKLEPEQRFENIPRLAI